MAAFSQGLRGVSPLASLCALGPGRHCNRRPRSFMVFGDSPRAMSAFRRGCGILTAAKTHGLPPSRVGSQQQIRLRKAAGLARCADLLWSEAFSLPGSLGILGALRKRMEHKAADLTSHFRQMVAHGLAVGTLRQD